MSFRETGIRRVQAFWSSLITQSIHDILMDQLYGTGIVGYSSVIFLLPNELVLVGIWGGGEIISEVSTSWIALRLSTLSIPLEHLPGTVEGGYLSAENRICLVY